MLIPDMHDAAVSAGYVYVHSQRVAAAAPANQLFMKYKIAPYLCQ